MNKLKKVLNILNLWITTVGFILPFFVSIAYITTHGYPIHKQILSGVALSFAIAAIQQFCWRHRHWFYIFKTNTNIKQNKK